MTWAGAVIGLGGAQFGLDYGITNRRGRVARSELETILTVATKRGIAFIDTAPAYGNSEAAIGRAARATPFRIITKTPKLAAAQTAADAALMVDRALRTSLNRLRVRAVDGLLVHDSGDLLGRHGDAIWAALEAAKANGLTRRIGVSVYDGAATDLALARYPLDIVQLPYNVLDDRLDRGGQLDRLARAKVAIHVRSIFLQGLLLAEPDDIADRFGPLRDAVAEFHAWTAQNNLTPQEAAFAGVLGRPEIELCIVGVTSLAELEQIITVADRAATLQTASKFSREVPVPDRYLDPSRWSDL